MGKGSLWNGERSLGRIVFSTPRGGGDQCIFCRIVSRTAPSNVVYEDEKHIAFLDAFPSSRGHTLVSPKQHGETIWDMGESEISELFMVASRISKAVVEATRADGFRFVQNNGEAADQAVAHVHVHVIPVKMENKGKYGGRLKFSPEEMAEIASSIRDKLGRDQA